MQTIPQIIRDIQAGHPGLNAQYFRRNGTGPFEARGFADFYQDCLDFGAGLRSLGLEAGEAVGLIADNRREWTVADIGIQACGAADVPRGRDITDAEIRYILGATACRFAVLERGDELSRIAAASAELPALETLIVMEEEFKPLGAAAPRVLPFSKLVELGKAWRAGHQGAMEASVERGKSEDVATIIFTSGTTGRPKGVPLTQENYALHVSGGRERMGTEAGDVWLTLLPVWHSFERAVQYIALGNGVGLAYSKPIGSIMMRDFAEVNPHYTTAVPRIWESVYNTIQKKMNDAGGIKKALFRFFVAVGAAYVVMDNLYKGLTPAFKRRSRALDKVLSALPRLLLMPLNALGSALVFKPVKKLFGSRLKAGVSGGGSLRRKIDLFFAAAGIVLMEGYGLTEAGPVVAVRSIRALEAGTVGKAFPGIEMKLLKPDGRECRQGEMGLIHVRGAQVMKGYYGDPESSAKVLRPDGWLDTGDLGILTGDGSLSIVGRLKDTIVLSGGENVEPVPIEKRLAYSPLIETAVVVGQDQRHLGALIVPDFKALQERAAEKGIAHQGIEDLVSKDEIKELYRREIDDYVNSKHGFKYFERIAKFALLTKSFEVPRELSAKQELKRAEVNGLYARRIKEIFE
jgi:long-chain acyl-CoA synthetase